MSSRKIVILFLSGLLVCGFALAGENLEQDFRSPPEITKPRCYWFWFNGKYSKEGITKDLEAMRRVGIGEAYLCPLGGSGKGGVQYLTEEWWQYLDHAVREGTRIGVDICLFICPGGWNMASGPWVKPEDSMRYMALDEVRVQGPGKVKLAFPPPKKDATLITYLAFPAPTGDDDEILNHAPKVIGDPKTGMIRYEVAEPFTARSLILKPQSPVNVTCELEASRDGKEFHKVCQVLLSRKMVTELTAKGPVMLAPVSVSFPVTTAKAFRLNFSQPCDSVQITLSGGTRIERYMEKQLATMFEGSNPPYNYYTWPLQAEPERPDLAIRKESVVVIRPGVGADGQLAWDPPAPGSSGVTSPPAGPWVVQRVMAVPTGVLNVSLRNREVDKMKPEAVKAHYRAFVGTLLSRLPASERKSIKRIVSDSWEVGSQNWTEDMFAVFQSRYGYDPRPFLPTLSGRIVGGTDQSDRFLWDLRRLVADRIANDYIRVLREEANRDGMKLWVENYGHGGFPAESLNLGGQSDEIGGEFWNASPYDQTNLRIASSAAHIYGKKEVFSEAFTCGMPLRSTPATLKCLNDAAYSRGVNQMVLVLCTHKPDERKPGVYPFGTEFDRQNPWYDYSGPFMDYQRRCTVLLQRGNPVADVAYYITEDTPKMDGPCEPGLPGGYDFDYLNAEVIQNRLTVQDGRFVLPDGTSYKLLVLPASDTMRPAVLKKIKELVDAGGAVQCAQAPSRSPSLQDYPTCDEQVRTLAKTLWASGRMMADTNLTSVLTRLQILPDVIAPKSIVWKHRREGEREIYFLANLSATPAKARVLFRVSGRQPELWDPMTAQRRPLPQFAATADGRTEIELEFEPSGSMFIVFQKWDLTTKVTKNTKAAQNFPEYKPVLELTGPWSVAFDSKWFYPKVGTPLRDVRGRHGVPSLPEEYQEVIFEKLEDWTKQPEEAIKYYAGVATYRQTFAYTRGPGQASPLFLDLGKVHDLARVRLNGQDLGIVWTEPYRLAVGSALKAGTNTLEIEIATPWINRVRGDDTLEQSRRRTFLIETFGAINKGQALFPSGLLGPVRVVSQE